MHDPRPPVQCDRYPCLRLGRAARVREARDIDLLVELEPGRTLFELGGLSNDLERLFDRSVDVITVCLLRA